MPALRPTWSELPTGLRTHAARLLDADAEAVEADSQDGGFTPGAALRILHTASGRRLFLKAIPADHPLADAYDREASTIERLPRQGFRPDLIWAGHLDGWTAMAIADVEGRHPDLSPSSPDIPAVAAAISAMSASLDPSPLDAAPVAVPSGWRSLTEADLDGTEQAWAIPHLAALADLEDRWAERAASGKALVHNDIRPDNLLIRDNGAVVVVDWAQARCGFPWRDTYSLAPHLVMAGHTAATAENVLAGPLADADADLVTANIVALGGYLIRSAPYPAPPNVPHLRPYQARAARAASALIRHRTGW
ncbi:Phosphotransferase enzyme family protein [Sinosporangium album]|uniref:Phosphotransferase enzyme family protein n=1 Tax=Sinosporangium album TaxID=504805 RepID=A0A1G8HYC3_9ACTN|nr:phosphotransferase [Sinosporangium album]SDI11607.1 Phosphotransferase enzyme family protein [Sinosporangium album]